MRVHLIGNGPSKANYIPDESPAFGCNFASFDLKLEGTFIHDSRVFEHIIRHNLKLPWPVISRQYQSRRFGNCKGLIQTMDVVSFNGGTTSSGHMGLRWLIAHGYKEIHIWGFDSLLSNSVESDSKGKIDGSDPNPGKLPEWDSAFAKIFTESKKIGVSIFVHRTKDWYTQV